MTSLEFRSLLDSRGLRNLRGLRQSCGFSRATFAAALGVPVPLLYAWEIRRTVPAGAAAERYARVVAGMARHLEVKDGSDEEGGKPS